MKDALLKAIQDRGSDATDLRDAAHEACHALVLKLRKPWTRRRIDDAAQREIRKRGRSWGFADETFARAVEQLVCAEVGAPCPSVEMCAMTAVLEAMTLDRVAIDHAAFVAAVKAAMGTERAKDMAAQIIALPTTKARKAS